MKKSNDFQTKGNYPFMKMPKRELETSDFDEKLADLGSFILQRVYPFFMWYGSITKGRGDELRSILFLEGLFLQMLLAIREIFLMRGKKLCNECTDKFKDILVELNEKMRKGTQYIQRSNRCLEEELNSETSCVASMRQDILNGFRELSGWLHEELGKANNKKRAEALADELELHYNMKQYGCIGDNFEQHTNMVLNGLMLLSLPSMPDTQTDDFCLLFDNSIAELKARRSWRWAFDSWRKKIDKEYDLNDIVEDKDKVVYLKEIWKALDEQEQEFLGRFNIVADPTRSTTEKATMGFRIYEHLNADTFDDSDRMTTDDLQQYLLFVVQKHWLDDEICRLKPKHIVDVQPNPPSKKVKKKRPLFKPDTNLAYLKGCMNMVYQRFCIDEDKETLEGDHNDLMAIMVYLYIICDTEGYFEDAYKDTNKVPFFKFCVEDVGFETTMKDRTFRNRFDQLIDVYKKYCLHTSQKLNVKTEKDYQKVLGIFHGKKYYKKLREDMNC